MKRIVIISSIAAFTALFTATSCNTSRKLSDIVNHKSAEVRLEVSDRNFENTLNDANLTPDSLKDTTVVETPDGRFVSVMNAIKDEQTGEMVATEVISPARITARFSNVAEREGKIDIAFRILVPKDVVCDKWQLRFTPRMFVLADSADFESLLITGEKYRKAQLRGYQLYEKFLSKIVADTTKFIDIEALELFIERNIPQIYGYKFDTTSIDETEFLSEYGVSEREAVEHYTDKAARRRNEKRKSDAPNMYSRYVKAPFITEGIKLDTLIITESDFQYNYVQSINVRPGMKKITVVLDGSILEDGAEIYKMPRSEPIFFYISSLSSFTEDRTRYLTRVIERRIDVNASYSINFELDKSVINPLYSDNVKEISNIERTLSALMEDEEYDIDSIEVAATASPEGSWRHNSELAGKRSEAITGHFTPYMKHCRDSLLKAKGLKAGLGGELSGPAAAAVPSLRPVRIPENWDDLDHLVADDAVLNISQKESYSNIRLIDNPDQREKALKKESYYNYLKDAIYPKLRVVKFEFALHRRGMVKDTVQTTVIDTVYADGVRALKNMDFKTALLKLSPYADYNTAVAYLGLNRNESAKDILRNMEQTARVSYLLAIAYSRQGDKDKAVEYYKKACCQERTFIFRGNLDPEISTLIKEYSLTNVNGDPVFE